MASFLVLPLQEPLWWVGELGADAALPGRLYSVAPEIYKTRPGSLWGGQQDKCIFLEPGTGYWDMLQGTGCPTGSDPRNTALQSHPLCASHKAGWAGSAAASQAGGASLSKMGEQQLETTTWKHTGAAALITGALCSSCLLGCCTAGCPL